jgi:hypothetical protein
MRFILAHIRLDIGRIARRIELYGKRCNRDAKGHGENKAFSDAHMQSDRRRRALEVGGAIGQQKARKSL